MASIMNPMEIYTAHKDNCEACYQASIAGQIEQPNDVKQCSVGKEYTRVAINFITTSEDAS